ncbi:unnamed protein product [Closterium sp. Yama58-4]|nr:unnamed protein product [Closterium sp. Yama58-4]
MRISATSSTVAEKNNYIFFRNAACTATPSNPRSKYRHRVLLPSIPLQRCVDTPSCHALLPPQAYTSRVSRGRPVLSDELLRVHRRWLRDQQQDDRSDREREDSSGQEGENRADELLRVHRRRLRDQQQEDRSDRERENMSGQEGVNRPEPPPSPSASPASPSYPQSFASFPAIFSENFPRNLTNRTDSANRTDSTNSTDSADSAETVDPAHSADRWLIWVPRAGLGNMLRALSSSFVYALLSGRRLLRWHGGPYGDAMNSLCAGFACGFDEIRFPNNNLPNYAEPLDRLVSNGEQMRRSLADPHPLVIVTMSSSFDRYWQEDKELTRCVMGALGCASDWCVWSRTMEILLGGGPTKALGYEIEKDVRIFPHVKSASAISGEIHNEAASARGKGLERLERERLRSRENGVRGSGKLRSRVRAEDAWDAGEAGDAGRGGVQVARRLSGETLLAGESGEGREGGTGGNPLAKGTGLRLQFDVSLHIRTGDWSFGLPHCGESDAACLLQRSHVAHDVASLFLQASHWLCLSSLLQLFRFRKWAAQMRAAERAVEPVDKRWALLAASEEWVAKTEASLSLGTRAAKQV